MLGETLKELGDALGNPSKLHLLCGAVSGKSSGGYEQQVHAKLGAGLAYESSAVQQQLRQVLKSKLEPRPRFVTSNVSFNSSKTCKWSLRLQKQNQRK